MISLYYSWRSLEDNNITGGNARWHNKISRCHGNIGTSELLNLPINVAYVFEFESISHKREDLPSVPVSV